MAAFRKETNNFLLEMHRVNKNRCEQGSNLFGVNYFP